MKFLEITSILKDFKNIKVVDYCYICNWYEAKKVSNILLLIFETCCYLEFAEKIVKVK